jgi:hypothetical protein
MKKIILCLSLGLSLFANNIYTIPEKGVNYNKVTDEQGRAYTKLDELREKASSGDAVAQQALEMIESGKAKINPETGVIYQD